MVDDHEELLSNSVAKLERVRHKHERLSKILISVKAGVEHLQDKLKSTATEVCIGRMACPLQHILYDLNYCTRGRGWISPTVSDKEGAPADVVAAADKKQASVGGIGTKTTLGHRVHRTKQSAAPMVVGLGCYHRRGL